MESTRNKVNLSCKYSKQILLIIRFKPGGARCVMVSVAGYGHGDTSSNPGPD